MLRRRGRRRRRQRRRLNGVDDRFAGVAGGARCRSVGFETNHAPLWPREDRRRRGGSGCMNGVRRKALWGCGRSSSLVVQSLASRGLCGGAVVGEPDAGKHGGGPRRRRATGRKKWKARGMMQTRESAKRRRATVAAASLCTQGGRRYKCAVARRCNNNMGGGVCYISVHHRQLPFGLACNIMYIVTLHTAELHSGVSAQRTGRRAN